jgi:(1->4)-alpha-D-glucan 1-alpha-D-glucosylmutase
LGILLDVVPNHLGVGFDNPLWVDLLKLGPDGLGARVFDVDWEALAGGNPGKVTLPVLGAPLSDVLANEELVIEHEPQPMLRYHEHRFPLRNDDASGTIAEILDRQHYKLAWWRTASETLNWRRFFDITELAGVRVEDPEVFERVYAKVFELWADGLIDGLRLDHVDGLADPGRHLNDLDKRLRQLSQREPWVLVEKIVGPDERLPEHWLTSGTTGYEVMNQILRLMINSDGLPTLDRTSREFGGDLGGFPDIVADSKRAILQGSLRAELDRLVIRLTRQCDVPPSRLREALIRTIISFPYYRTYGPIHRPLLETALGQTNDQEAANALALTLVPGSPLLTAFEQLSGPTMAKSLEDTAFYRWPRLVALNEVGGEPDEPILSVERFHAAMTERARTCPMALTATATHDTKRGEDKRMRLAALSHLADDWHDEVTIWAEMVPVGDTIPLDVAYMLFQTWVGIWPTDDVALAEIVDRSLAYAIKATREAKRETSWIDPNAEFERALEDWLRRCLAKNALVERINAFNEHLQPIADHLSMVQLMLKMTLPGVPDIYQGTETLDLSLVDPDNRRPINFSEIATYPDGAADKQKLIGELLELRKNHFDVFSSASYQPISAAPGTISFRRQHADRAVEIGAVIRPNWQLPSPPPGVVDRGYGWYRVCQA